jgi:hypothetical protein
LDERRMNEQDAIESMLRQTLDHADRVDAKPSQEYRDWLDEHNVPSKVQKQLLKHCLRSMWDTGPVYLSSQEEILNQNAPPSDLPVDIFAHGMIRIGTCANGDPVAVDFISESGCVAYWYHGDMSLPPRYVTNSLSKFISQLGKSKSPSDYHDR